MTDETTGRVVPLHPPRRNEPAFMRCAREPEGVNFLVVAIDAKAGPIVSALVCPACETELAVVKGIVQAPDGEG